MNFLVSTSGYSYKDWVGPFYPAGTKSDDYLSFFSKHFPFAELNFSYYKMPTPEQLAKMKTKVPKDFLFTIKAHKSITHDIDSDWKEGTKAFLDAIQALDRQLACIILQFPYKFGYTKENRLYLDSVLKEFESIPRVVEFRSNKWTNPRVYKSLEERSVGWVIPDLPKLNGLNFNPPASKDINYFRFHGRNTEKWWSGDNVTRYDYDYNTQEIEELVVQIRNRIDKAKINLGAFNNHARGQAVKNASALQKALNI